MAFGASPEEIAKISHAVEGQHAERRIEIEPENAAAVRLFLRMQSQWKIESLSAGNRAVLVYSGLDYTALPVVAGALGITLDEDILDRLGIMERESLRIHERRLQTLRSS